MAQFKIFQFAADLNASKATFKNALYKIRTNISSKFIHQMISKQIQLELALISVTKWRPLNQRCGTL